MSEMRNYAATIAKELGIDYEKILTMTMTEINNLETEKYKAAAQKRQNDSDRIKKIEALFPCYDFYQKYLGDAILIAASYRTDDELFEWSCEPNSHLDYDDPEVKRLFYKETNSYYSRHNFLKITKYHMGDIIDDAIKIKFPKFIKYSPEVSTYSSDTGAYQTLNFIIIRVTQEEKEEGEYDKKFSCTVESFFNMNWDAMLEDYLDSIAFDKVTSKDSADYKNTNNFISSPEIAEFIKMIGEHKNSN